MYLVDDFKLIHLLEELFGNVNAHYKNYTVGLILSLHVVTG